MIYSKPYLVFQLFLVILNAYFAGNKIGNYWQLNLIAAILLMSSISIKIVINIFKGE